MPWDAPEKAPCGAFERLLEGPCPAVGDLLLAVAAEFRAVDAARASFRLDELARRLFGVAAGGDPAAIAHRLATLITEDAGFRRDDRSTAGLLIDVVLDRRAGHPLVLAALAAEVGRRAGVCVGVCSAPAGWYAALGETDRLWLIDPMIDPGPTPSGRIRRHCSHEVAWAALTGLHARLLRDGDPDAADRAAVMRARLPVARHS